MSYVTVSKGTWSSISLLSNSHGQVGSMRINVAKQHTPCTSDHRMFSLAMGTLLAVAFGFNPVARAQDVATASGVQGQAQTVGNSSTQEGN